MFNKEREKEKGNKRCNNYSAVEQKPHPGESRRDEGLPPQDRRGRARGEAE